MTEPANASTPDGNDPKIEMRWSQVRNLILWLLAALGGVVGGAGGSVALGHELPPEVRQAIVEIRLTLAKMEAADDQRIKDVARLESRVDDVEKDVRTLERKNGAK